MIDTPVQGTGAALHPLLIVALAAAVTYLPRAIGVLAGRRIDPAGRFFLWFSCVAYAMLAGLVARMILLPIGPLQQVPDGARLTATAVGVVVFFVLRRNLALGLAAGLAALMVLTTV